MVMYDKSVYENAHDSLELDMKFDKSLPIDAEVTIRLDLQDNSLEGIAKVLTDAHRAFADNGCNFIKHALSAENDGMLVMVHEVTAADIESGELVRLLKEAKDNGSSGRIQVFIKGENK
jgi:oligoribonuclease (3'-5' exoribonuclease)